MHINFSIFLQFAQKSNWYPYSLNPVIDEIIETKGSKSMLDIGTGIGKLPEFLIKHDNLLKITGIDIDKKSVDKANKRINNKNIKFQYQEINKPIQFSDEHFDIITFCSVLFLLDDITKEKLINEALRMLKYTGKIIILTPSGKKSRFTAFFEIWKFPFSKYNWTYLIWKTVTTSGGRKWGKQKWLENFANRNHLNYSSILAFNNNVTIEKIIIKKQIK